MDALQIFERTMGTKRMFNNKKELTEQIRLYFINCNTNEQYPTTVGLTSGLGIRRNRVWDYGNGHKNGSVATAKKRKQGYHIIQMAYEAIDAFDMGTLKKGTGNTAGIIFSQKAYRKNYDRPEFKKDDDKQVVPAAQVIIKSGGGNNDLS